MNLKNWTTIYKLWTAKLTAKEIAKKTGQSTANVNRVLELLKKKFPSLFPSTPISTVSFDEKRDSDKIIYKF